MKLDTKTPNESRIFGIFERYVSYICVGVLTKKLDLRSGSNATDI